MSNSNGVYVPSGVLGTVAISLLAGVVVVEGWSAIFVGGYVGLEAEELTLASAIYGLLAVALLPLLLATCVAFCMWWHRVFSNLPALGAHQLEFTPSRAVWAFFIPFINLIRPHEVGQEIWKASDPRLHTNNADTRHSWAGSRLITIWWLVFIGASVFDRATMRVTDATAKTATALIGHLLWIAAGLCAIALIRKITARQNDRHSALIGAPESYPVAERPVLTMPSAG